MGWHSRRARFAGAATSNLSPLLGIRYGRGSRFAAPEPEVWGMVDLDRLKAFGPACPQPGERYRPQGEDCLFLNVWAPRTRPKRPRPVMVDFHGGAYSTGSVTDPLNDGAKLATRGDVVVVTVNHRLNALGYLYLSGRRGTRMAEFTTSPCSGRSTLNRCATPGTTRASTALAHSARLQSSAGGIGMGQ